MSGRSPFKRAKNRFLLQERDKEILLALYHYRFLTNNQIQSLLDFGCLTRINVRLRKLFDNKYLARRFLNNPYGRAKILHFLGPEGVETVSEKLGIDSLIIRRKQRQILKMKDSSLNHYLLINNFRLAFVLVSRSNPEIKIENWKTQKEIYLKIERNFYPDAYFSYRYQNEIFNLFLEIDHPLKSRKRFQQKIERYLKYGLEGYFQRQFGSRFFKVLIISPNQSKLKRVSRIVERITEKMFWLTTWEMITPEKILTPIWSSPRRERLFSLLEMK